MTATARRWILAGAAAALVAGAFAVQAHRLQTTARRSQASVLHGDSLEASLDLTRTLKTNDSLAYLRRIVQTTQHANALEDSLGLERRARYVLTVRVDSLTRAITTAPVTVDSEGTRRAHFDQVRPPYHLSADVALPRVGPGTLTSSIALDPIRLGATVGCGKAVAGVRPATLLLSPPSWAAVSLDSLAQDPAVCAAPKGLPAPPTGYGTWRLVKDALLVLLGAIGSHL